MGLFDYTTTSVLTFVALAVVTLVRLRQGWRQLFDSCVTRADKGLGALVGLILLTPLGVLVHELGHATVAVLFGARDIAIHYYVLWGAVSYFGPLTPQQHWLIAVAGPATGAIIGLVALALSVRVRPGLDEILRHFGLWTVFFNLVAYPALSLIGIIGDFHVIYSAQTPVLRIVAAAGHVTLGAIAIILYRRTAPHFENFDHELQFASRAMEPTIASGTTWYYRPLVGPIQRQSVVLCQLDNGIAVGRVVALPGETVEVHDGRLAIGGNSVAEPYVVTPMAYTIPPTVLGPDCYYVLGDNRNAAYDSHDCGPVRQAQIVGVQSPCC